MTLMLCVVACYTITSLSDKHAVAKLKFDGNSLTFVMAAATAFFMLAYLPFDSRLFTLTWQSFAAIILMAVSKMGEFQLAAIVLKEMSAFELKAWCGMTVFVSYAVDIVTGTSLLSLNTVWKVLFIALTAAGLFMIAKAGQGKIHYKKILLPLILYLASKFGYGLIVSTTKEYISPTLSLFFALVILTAVLAPVTHPIRLCREKPKGTLFVALTKIPNVAGLVLENAVAATSLANYSYIQPMILVVLFFIGIIPWKKKTEDAETAPQHGFRYDIAGGIVCIAGIIGFQLFT